MKYYQRLFSGDSDKYAMADLARRCATETLHVIDLPYRLSSWAIDDLDNVGLWFESEGKLAGWAVLQTPFWTIDIVCRPSEDLYQEILAWADQRAQEIVDRPSGHPAWYMMVFEDQSSRIHDL